MSGLPASATGTCDSGPRPAIRASISASTGGMTWAPSLRYSLYPLSAAGLWLAVIITPAEAARCRTAKASRGVGPGCGSMCTATPAPASTRAASSANSADRCRASHPTTTRTPPAGRCRQPPRSPARRALGPPSRAASPPPRPSRPGPRRGSSGSGPRRPRPAARPSRTPAAPRTGPATPRAPRVRPPAASEPPAGRKARSSSACSSARSLASGSSAIQPSTARRSSASLSLALTHRPPVIRSAAHPLMSMSRRRTEAANDACRPVAIERSRDHGPPKIMP